VRRLVAPRRSAGSQVPPPRPQRRRWTLGSEGSGRRRSRAPLGSVCAMRVGAVEEGVAADVGFWRAFLLRAKTGSASLGLGLSETVLQVCGMR